MESRHLALFLLIAFAVCSNGYKIVCYFDSRAVYRAGDCNFDVETIDPTLCTHVIYGFAGLSNNNDGTLVSLNPQYDLYDDYGFGAYDRLQRLKYTNPSLITLLAIGRWNEESEKYLDMAADPIKRSNFVNSAIQMLNDHRFDGLDFDFEYPGFRRGNDVDKSNYITLLKLMRQEFDKRGLLISSAVSAGKGTIDSANDIPKITSYFDQVHLMCYDYHGTWETFTGENAPMYSSPDAAICVGADDQFMNVNYSVNYWLSNGAPKEKLVLGMPLYGHTFSLSNPSYTGVCSTSYVKGSAGLCTQEFGTLGYNEICDLTQIGEWTVQWDNTTKTPYMHNQFEWVSYDNEQSIGYKAQFVVDMGLAGGMVWSIEMDDFHGKCGGRKNPLLSTINDVFSGAAPPTLSTSISATTTPITSLTTVTTSTAVTASPMTTIATTTDSTTTLTTTIPTTTASTITPTTTIPTTMISTTTPTTTIPTTTASTSTPTTTIPTTTASTTTPTTTIPTTTTVNSPTTTATTTVTSKTAPVTIRTITPRTTTTTSRPTAVTTTILPTTVTTSATTSRSTAKLSPSSTTIKPLPPYVDGLCARSGSGTYVRDPFDCSIFYSCSRDDDSGKWDALEFHCKPDYAFDPDFNRCRESWLVPGCH